MQDVRVDAHFTPLTKHGSRYSFVALADSQSTTGRSISPRERMSPSLSSPDLEISNQRAVVLAVNMETSNFEIGAKRKEHSVDRVREQLLAVGSSFADFDASVKEDVRRRKTVAEERRHSMLKSMDAIETVLQREAQQRADEDRFTHANIQKSLSDMLTGLQSKVSERFDTLTRSVESVHQRCLALERGIQQFRGQLPSKLEVDTSATSRGVKELAAQFEAHCKQTAQKDQHILQSIAEAHFGVDLQVERSLSQMERRTEMLQELIDELAQEEETPHRTPFEIDVLEQIAALKGQLSDESAARETADDAIIQAIDEYVEVMGRSLHFPNL